MERIALPEFLLIAESVTGVPAEQMHHGYCRLDLAEMALGAPFAGFGDHEVFPLFHQKAAAYCARIVRYHPLVDGNKRAGFVTMLMFASLNGYEWTHGRNGEDETVRAIECLAAGSIPEEHFENWVGHRLSRA